MTSPKRFALICIFSGLIHVSPSSASPIFDFTGSSGVGSAAAGRNGTVGWSFTLLTPMTVDGLGVWDENGNRLDDPQTVGLWTSGGTLLSSATVNKSITPTPSSSSAGQWLFTSVTPFVLDPGDYVLGALYATSSSSSSSGIRISPDALAIELETQPADTTARDADGDVLIRVVEQLENSYFASDPGIQGQAVIVLRAGDQQDPISTLTFTTIPGVTYTGARVGVGNTLAFPAIQLWLMASGRISAYKAYKQSQNPWHLCCSVPG
jgi:hypothetical protein